MPMQMASAFNITYPFSDLLCGVVHAFAPRFIQKIQRHVQDFIIVNDERRPLLLSLWEEFIQHEGLRLTENINNVPVILGICLSVSTFEGVTIGTLPHSTILFDPELPQTNPLKSCCAQRVHRNIIVQQLYKKEHQRAVPPTPSEICIIYDILNAAEPVKSFWIEASFTITKVDQHFYFLGCPNSDCLKPCGAPYGTDFKCLFYNNHFTSPKLIHNLRFEVELDDDTAKLNAKAEKREAETMLGIPADKIMAAEEQGNPFHPHEVNNKYKDVNMLFHIRASTSDPNTSPKYCKHTIIEYIQEHNSAPTTSMSAENGTSMDTASSTAKPLPKRSLDAADETTHPTIKQTKQD